MYLVVRKFMGKLFFAKEIINPQDRIGYKFEQQAIEEIMPLTEEGYALPLPVLEKAWEEGLFKMPSKFKQKEKPKVVQPKAPPKEQIIGASKE